MGSFFLKNLLNIFTLTHLSRELDSCSSVHFKSYFYENIKRKLETKNWRIARILGKMIAKVKILSSTF